MLFHLRSNFTGDIHDVFPAVKKRNLQSATCIRDHICTALRSVVAFAVLSPGETLTMRHNEHDKLLWKQRKRSTDTVMIIRGYGKMFWTVSTPSSVQYWAQEQESRRASCISPLVEIICKCRCWVVGRHARQKKNPFTCKHRLILYATSVMWMLPRHGPS